MMRQVLFFEPAVDGMLTSSNIFLVEAGCPGRSTRYWVWKPGARSRFGAYHETGFSSLQVPHWFLALFVATIGAMPWIGWSNKYSLRTLLIAMTLVAVVLGLIVWLG